MKVCVPFSAEIYFCDCELCQTKFGSQQRSVASHVAVMSFASTGTVPVRGTGQVIGI